MRVHTRHWYTAVHISFNTRVTSCKTSAQNHGTECVRKNPSTSAASPTLNPWTDNCTHAACGTPAPHSPHNGNLGSEGSAASAAAASAAAAPRPTRRRTTSAGSCSARQPRTIAPPPAISLGEIASCSRRAAKAAAHTGSVAKMTPASVEGTSRKMTARGWVWIRYGLGTDQCRACAGPGRSLGDR